MDQTRFDDLTAALEEVNAVAPAAAALFDYQTGRSWSFSGDRWFHAASTIKVAVLACTYTTLQERNLTPSHQLDVRNRFFRAADEVEQDIRGQVAADGNHAARLILADAGVTGIELVRGVEDDRAFEAGISNRVTAEGLVGLLRAILEGRFGSEACKEEMLGILCAQTFNNGIPAGLPSSIRGVARIAHKTGEISTVTHDAGIVFLPGRQPYALAVLTGTGPDAPDRYEPIARISRRAFNCIAGAAARLENRP